MLFLFFLRCHSTYNFSGIWKVDSVINWVNSVFCSDLLILENKFVNGLYIDTKEFKQKLSILCIPEDFHVFFLFEKRFHFCLFLSNIFNLFCTTLRIHFISLFLITELSHFFIRSCFFNRLC